MPHPMRPGVHEDAPIMFTHADLHQRNIIVSTSASRPRAVLAIIDWHQSGWYLAYWEACKSILCTWPESDWGKGLLSVFMPYHDYLPTFPYLVSAGIAI